MSNFLLVLINDLNYFSKIQVQKDFETNKQKINLINLLKFISEISNSLIDKYNKSNSLIFEVVNKTNIVNFYCDEIKLKQVLLNLISNSVKFTSEGRIVLIAYLIKIENEEMISFSIEDTGIGIKEEEQTNLFKPLITRKLNHKDLSSGLGLYIVKEIVDKLGGKIQFNSIYQKGTVAEFNIPLILSLESEIIFDHTYSFESSEIVRKSKLNRGTTLAKTDDLGDDFDDDKTNVIEFLPENFKSNFEIELKQFPHCIGNSYKNSKVLIYI